MKIIEPFIESSILNNFYIQAGKEDEAQSDLLLACECYKKKRAWFSAAKALEQVITICLKKKTHEDEKSALIACVQTVCDQHPKTAAYQDKLGCKVASKEVCRCLENSCVHDTGTIKFSRQSDE